MNGATVGVAAATGRFRWTICALLFGAVTAMAFAQSAGVILASTGSDWSLFAIASSAYLLALALIHVLAPRLAPATL